MVHLSLPATPPLAARTRRSHRGTARRASPSPPPDARPEDTATLKCQHKQQRHPNAFSLSHLWVDGRCGRGRVVVDGLQGDVRVHLLGPPTQTQGRQTEDTPYTKIKRHHISPRNSPPTRCIGRASPLLLLRGHGWPALPSPPHPSRRRTALPAPLAPSLWPLPVPEGPRAVGRVECVGVLLLLLHVVVLLLQEPVELPLQTTHLLPLQQTNTPHHNQIHTYKGQTGTALDAVLCLMSR